jgi:hypothetical protein
VATRRGVVACSRVVSWCAHASQAFELEQAQGEKLNELTEKYYKRHQRGFDDPWPNKQFLQSDSTLRKMLTSFTEIKPAEIVKMAKAELQIDLDS